MASKLIDRSLGYRDPGVEGIRRSLRGLREGDYRQLTLGLTLTAISYLRRTAPKKQLLYRKTLPKGSALVIHHKKRGGSKLEIRKP